MNVKSKVFFYIGLIGLLVNSSCKEDDPSYPLIVNVHPDSDAATVSIDPEMSEYPEGTEVTVSVTDVYRPYYFVTWNGSDYTTETSMTFTMSRAKIVNANFMYKAEETFDDGEANYFTSGNDSYWTVDNAALTVNCTQNNDAWTYDLYDFSKCETFELSADIKQLASANPDLTSYYGLAFKTQDIDNSYFLNINSSGSWYVGVVVDGEFSYLLDEDENDLQTSENLLTGIGEVNNVKVVCYGSDIYVYINGVYQKTFSDEDETFSSGSVGVIAYDSASDDNIYSFDNFYLNQVTDAPDVEE